MKTKNGFKKTGRPVENEKNNKIKKVTNNPCFSMDKIAYCIRKTFIFFTTTCKDMRTIPTIK